jgi:hypothetical protein
MNQAGLQLEQAPPIAVPFRFFLVAPAFLLLAAAVLLWRGPEALAARLSPATIAMAHLVAIGFVAMVMMGAMMQMLPVLQGSPVPRPRETAALTGAAVGLGTVALAAGFLSGERWLLNAGALALAAGFIVFVSAVLVCLARAPSQNHTVRAMWLAVLSLLVTVVFGVMLAMLFGLGVALPNSSVHSLHPGWGMLGWTGLLVVGVGFELVPMLQMTPHYPKPMTRYLAPAILLLLVLWSAALWIDEGRWGALGLACAVATAAAYALFAVVTMVLHRRRRRRLPDVTLDFWRVGMGCLLGASLAWGVRVAWAGPWFDPVPESIDILIGVLALFGFAGSVISGMLYKIMPFLAWFHLQSMCGPGARAPNMKKILPDARQRLQFRSHVLALALLCAAALWPGTFVYAAALALGATAVLLEFNMLLVVRAYRKNVRQESEAHSGSPA